MNIYHGAAYEGRHDIVEYPTPPEFLPKPTEYEPSAELARQESTGMDLAQSPTGHTLSMAERGQPQIGIDDTRPRREPGDPLTDVTRADTHRNRWGGVGNIVIDVTNNPFGGVRPHRFATPRRPRT